MTAGTAVLTSRTKSMTDIISREIQLVSRPKGMPTPDNFTITQTEIKPLQDGQVLVRNHYISVDPYMRGRMNESKSYVPPFELGKTLEGGAVGEVIESRAQEFKPGDVVTEKVKFLLEECGFDRAFNYNSGPILEQLNQAAPDGIDVYFDNVGGETLQAALSALRVHGRIIACGGISGYNKPQPGPNNLFNMIGKRLTMKGLLVRDWLDRQSEFEQEAGGYFQAGKLKNQETVVAGIDQAVGAFIGLFEGKNIGKMVVKLDQAATN